MFGRNKITIAAIIGRNVVCNGDFTSQESARIDGTVEGNVIIGGTLIVGECGVVNGNVKAKAAVIGGRVYGNVDAPERIELTTTATLIGDMKTAAVVVDDGAVFHGHCDMGRANAQEEQAADVEDTQTRKTPTDVPTAEPVQPDKKEKKSAKSAFFKALRELKEAGEAPASQESSQEDAVTGQPSQGEEQIREE